jgi:serine/threonine-protein kinase
VPQVVARFLREAEVVQRLAHPNIVSLHEVGWIDGGRPFLVMERLDGWSLGRILTQRGSLPVRETLDYFGPICNALGAAHRAGIVHRDLKPSNVMVSHPGQELWVKLIDFGIAKLVAPEVPRLTRTGSQVGTLTVMSPEQLLGMPVDWRTDIYALGVLLYQCVTGQRPFVGSTITLEQMHLHAPAPRPSRIAPVGPGIDRVILRCMQKDPDRRYLSADTFLIDLRAAVEEYGAEPVLAVGTSEMPRSEAEAAVAAAAAAAAAASGGTEADGAAAPAPAATAAGMVRVVGLYAEVLADGGPVDWDELDDDALDEVEFAMEQIVDRAREDGHVVAVRTGSAAMACRALDEVDDTRDGMERIMGSARALVGALRGRPAAGARIEIAVYLDVGEARRVGSGPLPTFSGPFVEARPWLPSPLTAGIWSSPAIVERMKGDANGTAWHRLEDG